MKKLFLITALMLISIVNALAEEYTDANGVTWSFSVSKTEATITGASGYGADLVIPEKVLIGETEYAVTSIRYDAFNNCSSLTSVDLSNCTSIGSRAFSDCSSLTSVDLSNCTSIGYDAFSGCSSLTSVDLSNCTSIGSQAFSGCSSLTSVGSLAKLTTIPVSAFNRCSSLTSVDLSNCTSLGSSAFSDCSSLASVDLSNCTSIGSSAFYGCSSLKLIENLSKIVSIGENAFDGNSYAVFTITNETPPTVGNGCFGPTTVIKVPENLVTTYQTADGWENYALHIISTTAQTDYDITTDLDNSKDIYTIVGENNLRNVVNLKVSGDIASFDVLMIRSKTPNLHYLDLTDANFIARDGDKPYYGDYVTRDNIINSYSFYNLDKLIEVKLPKSITSIGSYAFSGCSFLQSIVIPEGVKSIGNNSFYNCYRLSSVKLPSTLETIGYFAFSNCEIDEISLPIGLKTIKYDAFAANKIKEVRIPSSVTYIGSGAFGSTPKSVYMYILDPSQLDIDQDAFTMDTKTYGTLYYPKEDSCDVRNRFYYSDAKWADFQTLQTFKGKYEFVNFDKDYYLEDERIEGDSIEVNLNPGSGLTVEGGEQQDFDDVHIKHDGDKGGSIIGNGNICANNLYFDIKVRAGKWYFFSFPFNVDLSDITYPGLYVWYEYDGGKRAEKGSGGWTKLDGNTTCLERGKGYIFQSSEDGTLHVTVKKENFGNFDKDDHKHGLDTHASDNAHNASWNFMGNPHTGYYGIADMGYDAPITVWDKNNNTYKAVRPGDDDYHLQPFEAFFVQKPDGMSEMEFKGEHKKTHTQSKHAESEAKQRRLAKGVNTERMLINLSISDGANSDNTRVVFNAKQTKDYEMNCDAAKFMSTEAVPQLYTMNDNMVKYAINERPVGSVNLCYVATKAGELTIEAVRMDKPVVLKDLVAGITFDLSSGSYTFDTAKGTFDKRFVLMPDSESTGIADIQGKTGVSIMTTEGGISLSGTSGKNVSIHSVTGAQMAANAGDGIIALQTGAYIVTVEGMSTKIFVK